MNVRDAKRALASQRLNGRKPARMLGGQLKLILTIAVEGFSASRRGGVAVAVAVSLADRPIQLGEWRQ